MKISRHFVNQNIALDPATLVSFESLLSLFYVHTGFSMRMVPMVLHSHNSTFCLPHDVSLAIEFDLIERAVHVDLVVSHDVHSVYGDTRAWHLW